MKRTSLKSGKTLSTASSDIADGIEAVDIDPGRLTSEVSDIARALVRTDVNVLTLQTGGIKYID